MVRAKHNAIWNLTQQVMHRMNSGLSTMGGETMTTQRRLISLERRLDTIGKRLDYALRVREMSAAQAAKRSSASASGISHMRNDITYDMRAANLLDLCRVLRISPYWLLYGQGDMDMATGGPSPYDPELLARTIESVVTIERDMSAKLKPRQISRICVSMYEAAVSEGDLPSSHVLRALIRTIT